MRKTIRKRFDLPTVTKADETVKDDFELDKHAVLVTGLLLVSDRDEQSYHRGAIGIQINGEEILPDNYHAKLLMSGVGVAPKDRFLPFEIEPGNGIVKIMYSDWSNPSQAYSTYTPSVYVEYEIEVNDAG